MRKTVTFIMRLWVDPQNSHPNIEGQVECIADGDKAHVFSIEDLSHFIKIHSRIQHDTPVNSTENFIDKQTD